MQTLFDAISTILIIGSLTFGLQGAHDFIKEKAFKKAATGLPPMTEIARTLTGK